MSNDTSHFLAVEQVKGMTMIVAFSLPAVNTESGSVLIVQPNLPAFRLSELIQVISTRPQTVFIQGLNKISLET
jgi:hypothetical protein